MIAGRYYFGEGPWIHQVLRMFMCRTRCLCLNQNSNWKILCVCFIASSREPSTGLIWNNLERLLRWFEKFTVLVKCVNLNACASLSSAPNKTQRKMFVAVIASTIYRQRVGRGHARKTKKHQDGANRFRTVCTCRPIASSPALSPR